MDALRQHILEVMDDETAKAEAVEQFRTAAAQNRGIGKIMCLAIAKLFEIAP